MSGGRAREKGAPAGRRVVSMRLVVTTATVALIVAAVLGVGAVSERNVRSALTREIETRLLLEARNLALTSAGALLSELPELVLHPVVRKMQTDRPELAFVVVVDHRGVIQGHADARRLGSPWAPPAGLMPVPGERLLEPGERLLGSRDLLVVESPVKPPGAERIGSAIVAVRRAYVEATVSAARRELALYLVVLLAVGVTLALLLMTGLLRPIGALRAGLERIGRGDLDTPLKLRDRTELGMLADTVNDMAARLKVAQHEIVEKERLAHEVELARQIQQRLLPSGRREAGDFALVGDHRAAAEVGGDYYDILPLPEGLVGVAVADVAGKGLGGCLVMSMLSALLRALRTRHASPADLLAALEEQLDPMLPRGEFITMFYGVLDPATGRLVYASAGHLPALLYRASSGNVEWRTTRGIPLGALRGGTLRTTLEDVVVDLEPGDLLVQFTDGCSEAFDAKGEQFGLDRIAAVVKSSATAGGDAVAQALAAAVQEWAGGTAPLDDETLLVVARRAVAGARAAPGASATPLAKADPLAVLEEAQTVGCALALTADLDSLKAIRPWLERCPDLQELGPDALSRLESALYEVCANMAEHGYRNDPAQPIHLWWVPGSARAGVPAGEPADPAGRRDARVRRGCFVLRDRGFPFSPGRRQPADFNDPQVWKRGRGFGLDIVHLALSEVVYRPATEAGNVTLLSFDPAGAQEPGKELRHV